MNEAKIFAEMMVHIPLCTHFEAKDVLVVGGSSNEIDFELEKHKKESNFIFKNLNELENIDAKSFDVAILLEDKIDLKIAGTIFNILKNDGLFTFTSHNFVKDEELLKKDLKTVGENFNIAMPYKFSHTISILASKKYHPTADIALQRADFLEDLDYYNVEVHLASFVFANKIHKSLTGFAKR